MGNEIINLERRVYQLTGEFSNAFTQASVALNTPPLTPRTLELVRECHALGEDYEAALDELLSALRDAPAPDNGEAGRVENLKTQLRRELRLLQSHPALASSP